jgi:hypothetical protein
VWSAISFPATYQSIKHLKNDLTIEMMWHTSNQGIVGIVKGSKVGHPRGASIGILAVGEELVHGVKRIRLDGIISSEDDELRDFRLFASISRSDGSGVVKGQNTHKVYRKSIISI